MTKVVITTAVELSEKQLSSMHQALTRKLGKDIQIQTEVHPQVIGGVRLTIGSQAYDATIQAKLEQVSRALAAHA